MTSVPTASVSIRNASCPYGELIIGWVADFFECQSVWRHHLNPRVAHPQLGELGQLRMNEDGTLGLRASVLNLMVVTDEGSAQEITQSVSNIAGRYPSRAIVLISDPEEGETNLEFQLSAFCSVRGGGGAQGRAGGRQAR